MTDDPYADDPQYAGLLPPEPDLLSKVREHRLLAARLEMGRVALTRLIVHVRAAGNVLDPSPYDPPARAEMLYGVPIVDSEALPPDGWRLLDSDGNIISEGTLKP